MIRATKITVALDTCLIDDFDMNINLIVNDEKTRCDIFCTKSSPLSKIMGAQYNILVFRLPPFFSVSGHPVK